MSKKMIHIEEDYEIIYKGVKYPVWEVSYGKEKGLVSTVELQNRLFVGDFEEYADDDAQKIDEKIMFFVDENDTIEDVIDCIWR